MGSKARVVRAVAETLEDRRLLSAFHAPGGGSARVALRPDEVRVSFFAGTLTVVGTDNSDGDSIVVAATNENDVVVNGEPVGYRGRNLAAGLVRRIVVHARRGDDTVDLRGVGSGAGFTRLAGTSVYAGDGNDVVKGSAARDVVYGGRGTDHVGGGDGNDVVYGQRDWDRLEGDAGDDRLVGEDGGDILYGGEGDDYLDGGVGDDVLYAAGYGGYVEDEGADALVGGSGDDEYAWVGSGRGDSIVREAANGGVDELNFYAYAYGADLDLTSTEARALGDGGSIRLVNPIAIENVTGSLHGWDRIIGNHLDNFLDGQEGNNYLDGGGGDDVIGAFGGDDTMIGGAGDDEFYDLGGSDELNGGSGDDVYRFVGSYRFGTDRIVEPADADTDTLDLSQAAGSVTLDLGLSGVQVVTDALSLAFEHGSEIENVIVPQNDFFTGWRHRVTGNARDNRIVGGPNGDTLDGAGGDDTIVGGGGPDVLIGGEGRDAFDARDGQVDDLDGGADEDSILSKDDDDVLNEIP